MIRTAFIEISEEQFEKARQTFMYGCNVKADNMDYPEFCGLLSLFEAIGLPLSRVYFEGGVEQCFSNARDITSELPCRMEVAGIEFVLVANEGGCTA